MKFQINEKEKMMSVIEKMLKQLNDKSTSGIYLREIALLMEEIEMLKDKVRDREETIKNIVKDMEEK